MARRKYSDEFKREAVELTREPGVTKAQIARELDISATLLRRWEQALEAEDRPFPGRGDQPKIPLPVPTLDLLVLHAATVSSLNIAPNAAGVQSFKNPCGPSSLYSCSRWSATACAS